MSRTSMSSCHSRDGGRLMDQVLALAAWPGRVVRARREMGRLVALSEAELRDLGLFRQDLVDATALPLHADPTRFLARVREERRGAGCVGEPAGRRC